MPRLWAVPQRDGAVSKGAPPTCSSRCHDQRDGVTGAMATGGVACQQRWRLWAVPLRLLRHPAGVGASSCVAGCGHSARVVAGGRSLGGACHAINS